MRVCIDFDGTVYNGNNHTVINGAKEGILKLKEKGFDILIYSCRTSYEFRKYPIDRNQEIAFMEAFLNENGIPFDKVLNVDKPIANYYLDDRAREINNNWEDVVLDLISEEEGIRNNKIQHFELVAVIDGCGDNKEANLYLEYDGEIMQEIRWPDDWPDKVSNSFLREKGFKVHTS